MPIAQDPQPGPACTARPGSVYPRCGCEGCLRRRRRRAKLLAAGLAGPTSDQAWAVLRDLWGRRGWSPGAIASATGRSVDTIQRYRKLDRAGHPCRINPSNAAAIVRYGDPHLGRVRAVGTTRRLRALARAGWGLPDIAAESGYATTTLVQLQRGDTVTVRPDIALAVASLYDAWDGRAGGAWTVIRKALQAGWAPREAWADLDIDAPGAVPPGYPDADRAAPTAAERARKAKDRDRHAARRRAERQAARAAKAPAAAGNPIGGATDARVGAYRQ